MSSQRYKTTLPLGFFPPPNGGTEGGSKTIEGWVGFFMNKININATQAQTCSCEELEALAHDYLSVQQLPSDPTCGCRSNAEVNLPSSIIVKDGAYDNTLKAIRNLGITVTNQGDEYIRILDQTSLDFIKSKISKTSKLTKSDFTKISFASGDNISSKVVDCSWFKYCTQVGGLWQSGIFKSGTKIKRIDFPPNNIRVSNYCSYEGFDGCTNLEIVGINSSMQFIEWTIFNNTNVKKVIFDSITHIFTTNYGYAAANNPSYMGKASLYLYADEDTPLGTETNPLVIPTSITAFNDYALYNYKTLNVIKYAGTIAQYKAITRGTDWHTNVPCTTIVCSDGTCGIDDVAS